MNPAAIKSDADSNSWHGERNLYWGYFNFTNWDEPIMCQPNTTLQDNQTQTLLKLYGPIWVKVIVASLWVNHHRDPETQRHRDTRHYKVLTLLRLQVAVERSTRLGTVAVKTNLFDKSRHSRELAPVSVSLFPLTLSSRPRLGINETRR